MHVNHLYPRGGDVAGGTPVTVTGRGFIAPAICRFAPRTLSAADVSRLAPVNATVRSSTELVCAATVAAAIAPTCRNPRPATLAPRLLWHGPSCDFGQFGPSDA